MSADVVASVLSVASPTFSAFPCVQVLERLNVQPDNKSKMAM